MGTILHPEVWNESRRPKLAGGLVRPGIALYGVQSTADQCRWHAIGTGRCAGAAGSKLEEPHYHGARSARRAADRLQWNLWLTKNPSRVASIPVGYADGLSRRLSNRGHVLVRGVQASVIGNVSVDITTIDVTDVPAATVGDEVVLIGTQQGATITADDLAATVGTISHEVLCGIGKRVPRMYAE